MATALEQFAEQERINQIARNDYKENSQYGSTNLDALSNGDEKGKGERNGSVGSLSDINAHTSNTVKNVYSDTNQYGTTNVDALSNDQ